VSEAELRVAGAPVAVRRHPRARHLRLHVDAAGELRLTLPPRTSLRAAQAFLDEHRGWAERALRRVDAPGTLGLERRGSVPILGRRVPVRFAEAERARVSGRDSLVAAGPTRLAAAAALERWARRELQRRAEPLVAAGATALEIATPRLAVRAQRTRWGSASSRTRTLSLNWRLLLGTSEALDYVVVHELCHFLEMSHSPGFWRHVERLRPGYRTEQRWLRDHGTELLRWSPLRALEEAQDEPELVHPAGEDVLDLRMRVA
jgi:predicted metal-dependent hydrolase